MAWRYWSAIVLMAAVFGGLTVSLWHIGDAIARRAPDPVVVNLPPLSPPTRSGEDSLSGESPSDEPENTNLPYEALPEAETIVPIMVEGFPDDPAPHEGAAITVPYIVEPPDLIRIELLEALPGRPVMGERLVRPDGSVCLDFYGDLGVSGLTLEQIKVKTILHMRRFIPDKILGLVEVDFETKQPKFIPPEESDSVFVEVTSYNSKFYHVLGDVNAPGRLPFTGREMILDALNNVGGLAPTADRRNIRLHRPARGGRPAKTFPIDLDAIEQGDPTANLQVLPGDRLIIGRDKVVEATVKSQRLNEPLQTATSLIQHFAVMRKNLKEAGFSDVQAEKVIETFLKLHRDNAQRPEGPTFSEDDLGKALLPLQAGDRPGPAPSPRP